MVFISYRRSDAESEAGRLRDSVERRLGPGSVFLDHSAIGAGAAFPAAIREGLERASAVIILIGRHWLFSHDEHGRRRLDDPEDWVRREIEISLALGKRIVPVLVNGASMPSSEALPAELRSLASIQALDVRSGYWDHDVELVLRTVAPGDDRGNAVEPRDSSRPQLTPEAFRVLAGRFSSRSVDERRAAADEVVEVALDVAFDDVLRSCRSRVHADRVAAAIALRVHMQASRAARDDPRARAALTALLNDERPRVRYRAAEAFRAFPMLAAENEDDLRRLADSDPYDDVRMAAERALQRVQR